MKREQTIRVQLNIEELANIFVKYGYYYVTPKKLASMLGISTRSAGRILALMNELGLIERWSRKTYKVTNRTDSFTLSLRGVSYFGRQG